MFSDRGRLGGGGEIGYDDAVVNGVPDGPGIDFRKVVTIVRRNALLLIIIVTTFFLIGLGITMLTTPKYVAEASIQIDQQSDRVLETEDVEPVASYQDAERFLATQAEILRSDAMATRVAQAMNLFGNKSFFDAMNAELPGPGPRQAQETRNATLDLLTDNMTIRQPGGSRITMIAFETPAPGLSSRIANTYAEEFIKSNLQRKFDSSLYARNFLRGQLAEAKQRLEASEQNLNAYARRAGIIRTGSTSSEDGSSSSTGSVVTSSLVQANAAANQARTARISAEQRWRNLGSAPLLSIPEVLQNNAVQRLLEQRATVEGSLQQERIRHLDSHPTVRQLTAQLAEINGQIQSLGNSIRASIREQYEITQLQEDSLQEQVASFTDQTLAEQERGVQYGILSREVDTNRSLYDGLLQRYKEVSAAAGISTNNISIVDSAEPPARPSSPNIFVNLALAILAGLAVAGMLIFIREQIDDAIRGPDDLERKLGLPVLGVVPIAETGNAIAELDAPRSPVSEAYNALRTSLLYSTSEGLPPVIFVTSSQESEGKSTTSFAIAKSLARLDKRVVLVDIDLRRPALHTIVDRSNAVGLTSVLTSQSELGAALQETNLPLLTFIGSGPIPPSPTELLSSTRLRELIEQLRAQFDCVIFDGPPVLGLADAPLLAGQMDATIFITESNRGNRGGTKGAIRRLRAARANLLGSVLTKFDPSKSSEASGYYGYNYYNYGSPAAEKERA